MCFFSRIFSNLEAIRVFKNLEAIRKALQALIFNLRKDKKKKYILTISITLVKKSIETKCVYFHVLQTCENSHPSRGNKKGYDKYFTILTSICCPKKSKKYHYIN